MTTLRLSRSLRFDLAFAAVFGVLAWLCLAYARNHSPIALVWLPNALLVGVLIQTPTLRLRLIGLCSATLLAAALSSSDLTATQIAIRASVNMAEVLIVAIGMQGAGSHRGLDSLRRLGRFTLLSLIVPFALSVLVMGAFWSRGSAFAIAIGLSWGGAHTLGLLLVAPLVSIAYGLSKGTRHECRTSANEAAAFSVVALVLAVLLFSQSSYPLLFLTGPVVMLAALRLGQLGAAVTVVVHLLAGRRTLVSIAAGTLAYVLLVNLA